MALVLTWRAGQWIEITHKSGDKIRVLVSGFERERDVTAARLMFVDDPRNFQIGRANATIRETTRPRPLPELTPPANPDEEPQHRR